MSKLDEARQEMKALYIAGKVIDMNARFFNRFDGVMPHGIELVQHEAMMRSATALLSAMPFKAFSSTAPIIDKRRARRYHRKRTSKLKSEGAITIATSINPPSD